MRYQASIRRQVTRNIEDGPAPMRDFKPAEKVRTGAEIFREDHQGFVPSDHTIDWVHVVNEHNSIHPKLKDEIDKRRSIAKVTALTARKIDTTHCSSRKWSRKPKARPKIVRRKPKKTRRGNCKGKGVGKKRITGRKRRLNARCRCLHAKMPQNQKGGTDDVLTFDLSTPALRRFPPKGVLFLKSQRKGSKQGGSVETLYRNNGVGESDYQGVDSENPDTSIPSISSYNSFASTDHEPML